MSASDRIMTLLRRAPARTGSPRGASARRGWRSGAACLLAGLLFAAGASGADILSTSGNIYLDADANGVYNAVVNAAGRVGLGTLSPQGNLHVTGNLVLTDAGESAYRVLACDATGLGAWATAAGLFPATPWTTASGNAWLASGNTGMGMATPSTNLVVGGNLRLVDGRQAASRLLASDAAGMARWIDLSALASGWGVWSGNACAERGRVGVGTSAPTEALEVASGNLLASSGGNRFVLRCGATPCRLEAYNTWTSATVWERAVLDWTTTANTLRIGTETSGGTGRDVRFVYGGTLFGGYTDTNWAGFGSSGPGTRAAFMGQGVSPSGTDSVALGWSSAASAQFSTAVGAWANAPYAGRASFFPGQGIAQTNCMRSGMQWLNALTTDATPTVLSVPTAGSSTHTACGLNSNSSITVSGMILALSQDNTQTASFQVTGTWQNNGGTTSLVASAVTQVSNNANAWSLAASADDANDRWTLTATGAAATTIRWSGMLLVTEVTY